MYGPAKLVLLLTLIASSRCGQHSEHKPRDAEARTSVPYGTHIQIAPGKPSSALKTHIRNAEQSILPYPAKKVADFDLGPDEDLNSYDWLTNREVLFLLKRWGGWTLYRQKLADSSAISLE